MTEFAKLGTDFNRMMGRNKLRFFNVLLSRAFAGIFLYRLERSLFHVFGSYYKYIRIPLLPVFNLIQSYSNCELHYQANIGKGIRILHPSLGVVVNGLFTIGDYPIFTGGNCIGIRASEKEQTFLIGDCLEMGANSSIVGPLTLGNHITIGAGACVVKSFEEHKIVLAGVPAKIIKN
ncbi:serine acetyltransferase [Ascidiimonas sp. W6]|uniref:serine acetyltransferase n=1 Tax=Ascidiimonas meishanensis TaxID=3128903 RepID=UPI0030EF5C61